ncbi:MAG: hypothetical protein U5O39_19135 [Gammaproteobacteria bacterium]|nr:hypothetical protein [Gammaproteobacteria bacterium]
MPPPEAEYEAPGRPPSRTNPLVEQALAMLLRSPELASQFDEGVLASLDASPECELLVRLMRSIGADDVTSPAVLLASFQDSPEFEHLCRLAEGETLLDVEDFPDEFTGIIQSLVRRLESESIQEVIKSLAAKHPSELTDAEREMLVKLPRELKRRA